MRKKVDFAFTYWALIARNGPEVRSAHTVTYP